MQKYGRILLATIAIGLMAGTAGAANLLDYWNFDETSGTTLANAVAERPDVTMTNFSGSEWTTDVPTTLSYSTGALSFDQSLYQYLNLGQRSGYNGATDAFTLSFWMKPDSTGGSDMRLLGANLDAPTGITTPSTIRLDMSLEKMQEYTAGWRTTGSVTSDTWQHVALVLDNNFLTTYIDGVQRSVYSNTALNYHEIPDFCLGVKFRNSYGTSYSGSIDDVSAWDSVLMPWDVEALASGVNPNDFVSAVPSYDFTDYSKVVNISFATDELAPVYTGTGAISTAGTTWNAGLASDVYGGVGVDVVDAVDDAGNASGISVYLSGIEGTTDRGEETTVGDLFRSGLHVGRTTMNEWQIDGLVAGETYDLVIYHDGNGGISFTSGVDPALGGVVAEFTGDSRGTNYAAEEIWALGYNYSAMTITPTASTITGTLRATDSGIVVYNEWNLLGMQIALHETEEKAPGDANGDGKVDGSDVTILAGNWQKGVSDGLTAIWEEGDFNGDGKVDGSDVTILAGNWQYGVTAAAAAVPEPSTMVGLFSLLLLGLIKWAREAKKIAAMLLVALVVLAMSSVASAALTNYWNFEGTDYNDYYATDVVGSNTGTLMSFMGDEWEAETAAALSHSTTSLQFKNTNGSFVNVGDLGITNKEGESNPPVNAMTLSMWIKPTTLIPDMRLFGISNAASIATDDRNAQSLRINDEVGTFECFGPNRELPFINYMPADTTWPGGGNGYTWTSNTPKNSIQIDQWHHLTMVWSQDRIATYLNGELTALYHGPDALIDLCGVESAIGGKFKTYGTTFDGYVDDVAIWDQALSPEAVAELSNGTAPNVLVDTWADDTLPAYEQVVNVDFKYGFLPQYAGQGANAQAGTTWNEPVIVGARGAVGASQMDLVDSNGAATSIDVSVSGFKNGFAAPANSSYWLEPNALLDDRLIATVDTDNLWQIDGLEIGETYDIIFYGQGECDIELTAGAAADSTSLLVDSGERIMGITDDTPEDWDESVTYTILTVTPTDSTISGSILPSVEGVDFMGLAGIQVCKYAPIVSSAASVPEPTTWCGLIALFFGGLFLRRRIKR